jgi:hypothetical protein
MRAMPAATARSSFTSPIGRCRRYTCASCTSSSLALVSACTTRAWPLALPRHASIAADAALSACAGVTRSAGR